MQYVKGIKTKVVTKDGEVDLNIKLELEINVAANGAELGSLKIGNAQEEESSDEFLWAVPDFKQEKVKFGKKVKEEK